MAVNINVIGRLGADSEIREGKNGSKYVTFRLATDEFKNGKNETAWLNVYDYSERGLKMQQYWKKGTMLQLFGTETVNVYQSKTGDWLPSRDIRAYSIDFVNGGGNGSGTTEANASEQPTTTQAAVTPSCGTLTPPTANTAATVPSFSTVSEESDDLPF